MTLTNEEILKIKETDSRYFQNKFLKKFFKDLYPHLKTIKEKIHYHIYGPNYCKTCGKEISPIKIYCSSGCVSKDNEMKEKKKQIFLERYGTEHPNQSKEIQEKIEQTNLKNMV